MLVHPACIVHGLADARIALAPGLPVTLLSASGAGLYAGCSWWQQLVIQAKGERPDVQVTDILDCADGSGQAMAALRVGISCLVLWLSAPGRAAVAAIAAERGGLVLAAPPPALDLGQRRASRRLVDWLQRGALAGVRSGTGDKDGRLG